MFRKIIAGTAVAGALTFGVAGIAGASTTQRSTADRHARGGHVRQAPPQIAGPGPGGREAKVNARLPKAEAREAKAEGGRVTPSVAGPSSPTGIAKVQAPRDQRLQRRGWPRSSAGSAGASRPRLRLDRLDRLEPSAQSGRSLEKLGHQPGEPRPQIGPGRSRRWPSSRPRRRPGPRRPTARDAAGRHHDGPGLVALGLGQRLPEQRAQVRARRRGRASATSAGSV